MTSKGYHLTREFFDKTLAYSWDYEPISRVFDQDKIEQYLSHLNENDSYFIRKLLENTQYIQHEQFKSTLIQSFEAFANKIGKGEFYLLLPSFKIGSEHWITALLWSKLKELNLKRIIDIQTVLPFAENEIIDICVLDDAIYSGINVAEMINDFTYDLTKLLKTTQKNVGSHFRFHIVVPFASTSGMFRISTFCQREEIPHTFYFQCELPPLSSQLDISQYYPNQSTKKALDQFGAGDLSMPAVYFDHKVAGWCSTYYSIYVEGIIPEYSDDLGDEFGSLFTIPPSRSKITELEKLAQSFQN